MDWIPPGFLIIMAGKNAVLYDIPRDAWRDLDPPYTGTETWRVRNSPGAWCPPVGQMLFRWQQPAKVEGYAPDLGGSVRVPIIQAIRVGVT